SRTRALRGPARRDVMRVSSAHSPRHELRCRRRTPTGEAMMNRDRRTQDESHGAVQRKAAAPDAPGKATLTQMLATGSEGAAHSDAVQEIAAHGVADARSSLPHGSTIQQLFGRHDVSHVRAEVGGAGGAAAAQIGASAYATGDRVAFAQSPDLHTAA